MEKKQLTVMSLVWRWTSISCASSACTGVNLSVIAKSTQERTHARMKTPVNSCCRACVKFVGTGLTRLSLSLCPSCPCVPAYSWCPCASLLMSMCTTVPRAAAFRWCLCAMVLRWCLYVAATGESWHLGGCLVGSFLQEMSRSHCWERQQLFTMCCKSSGLARDAKKSHLPVCSNREGL